MADRTPDGTGYMHNGRFWPRGSGHTRHDHANPCYLCGWAPDRGIHSVPSGTEPHGGLGCHSFRSKGPQLEDASGVGRMDGQPNPLSHAHDRKEGP